MFQWQELRKFIGEKKYCLQLSVRIGRVVPENGVQEVL